VTEVSETGTAGARSPLVARLNRAFMAGRLVQRLLTNHPDVDLTSVRLREDGDELTVTGQIADDEPVEPPGPPMSMWSPAPWELQ